MKAIITQIESVVTPSGNSGHVVVPKAWIGKEVIVTLKEKESRRKNKHWLNLLENRWQMSACFGQGQGYHKWLL
jgi:putative transposon-encoded protein